MIIDAHTHVFNKKAGITRETEAARFWNMETSGDWLVTSMDFAGVGKAFLITYNSDDIRVNISPHDAEKGNLDSALSEEYGIEIFKRYPGRFYLFMDSVNPNKEGCYGRFLANIERGITGIKMLPGFFGVYMDDERFMPIYETCERRGIPVIADTSYWYVNSPGFPIQEPGGKDFTRHLEHTGAVAAAFPGLRIQMAHYGTPQEVGPIVNGGEYKYIAPFVKLMQKYDNLFVDTAALPFDTSPGYPFPDVAAFIKHLCGEIGS